MYLVFLYTLQVQNESPYNADPYLLHTTSPWHANNIHTVLNYELWPVSWENLLIFLLFYYQHHINNSVYNVIIFITHFISLSHLLPARTIGTRGRFFFRNPPPLPVAPPAFNLVSRICSLRRIASSNVSLLSILNTMTNKSPEIRK